jgi:23S rRNA (uracil1939-C5)-methyltransferase
VRRELRILSIGAQGDGYADGVHIPFALPGERLVADVASDRGRIVELLEASPQRTAPVCPHFEDCGGCALQHWARAPYLAWKVDRIRGSLAKVGLEAEILAPFAAAPASRRRVALHARKANGRTIIGFKSRRSWRVVPIHDCAIAHPDIVAALPALAALAGPLLEHRDSAPTLHVTRTLTGLDVDITGVERRSGGPSADARVLVAECAQQADFARVTLGGETLYQARIPTVRAGRAVVELPPGGFLQATPEAEAAMAAFIREGAVGARRIGDLYCGVGAFTFPLAELASTVAADVSAPAIAALATAQGAVGGLKGIEAAARDLDRRPFTEKDLKGIDTVVFDPPRAGAEAQSRHLAQSGVVRAIGVSCNPTTFARDARILVDGGFSLLRVLPVDQFLWSPHIELVGVFSREQSRS